jgi:hypothetical protein
MTILFGLLSACLTLFSSGFGLTLFLLRRAPRINVWECLCLSWLFGVGAISIMLWIFGAFLSGFALQITVAAFSVIIAAIGLKAKGPGKFVLSLPSNLLEWFLAAVLFLELGAVLLVSFKHTLGWDGLLVWEIKARYAFINGGSLPASYYSTTGRVFSHPEYPLGIPFTELWFYLWMGQPHQFWVKTVFGIFYLVGVILLALVATRLSGHRWSGLLVAALLSLVPFLTSAPGGVIVGYADFPLSVVYLTALGYLCSSLAADESNAFAVYGGCLPLLPWVKREGIVLWGVLVLFGFLVSWRDKKMPRFWKWLLPSVALVLGWQFYLKFVHCVPPSDFASPDYGKLIQNFDRIGPIFSILTREMSDQSDWGAFWLVAILGALYLIMRDRGLQSWLLIAATATPLFLYGSTYIFSNWQSYFAHVTSSLPRLLLHVVPASLLMISTGLPLSRREYHSVAATNAAK